MSSTVCPRCQHQRSEHDPGTMPGVCPACGIAYAKWLQAQDAAPAAPHTLSEAELAEDLAEELTEGRAAAVSATDQPEPWLQRAFHYTCFMPSDRHESAFWGHLVLYVLFCVWGWYFMWHGIDWLVLGESFLHGVNLPFHEYGHVMFSPFGEFWMYLGGSLFQVLLPWFPLLYFMVWQRDNFAASLMLWWSGQNLLDVAPYIADAPTRALPLIGGDAAAHDWWNLLVMTDALDAAGALATLCFALGCAVILLANAWGGFLLYVEFRGRTDPAFVAQTRDHNAPP